MKKCIIIPGFFLAGFVFLFSTAGCTKVQPGRTGTEDTTGSNPPADTTGTDTTDTIPPPPPTDTAHYLKRLEVYYRQSNPTATSHLTDYTFYVDNDKRVVAVGIKNYGPVLFDTATSYLFYSGNNSKPYKIITPNINMSGINQEVKFDTTFFRYDANNTLISDSSLEYVYNSATASFEKRPLIRSYSYSADSTKEYVEWLGTYSIDEPIAIIRNDTLDHNNHLINFLKSQFYFATYKGNFGLVEAASYSDFINPLANLNISGTFFSIIYTPVNKEILGNSNHKAISTSNILPYYMDFYSSKIPSMFYLSGQNSFNGFFLSDGFDIRITALSENSKYPSEISVGASTALDDRTIYRYYYE